MTHSHTNRWSLTKLHRQTLRALPLIVLSIAPAALANDAEQIDTLTARWSDIELQRSSLAANWRDRERLGKTQLDLLRAERRSLQAFLSAANSDRDEIDARRASLLAEQRALEASDDALRRGLSGMTVALAEIGARLPPPLQPEWEGQLAVLGDAEAPLSEQLAAVLAMLDAAAEFDGRLALNQTRMPIDGADRIVQQLYLGLSQGWYLSEDGAYAGSGRATITGWEWTDESGNSAFDRAGLRDAIEQIQSPGAQRLIELPVSIDTGSIAPIANSPASTDSPQTDAAP